MADLAELLKQWRAADSKAFSAEKALTDALMNLAQGKGGKPTEEMAALTKDLRQRSDEALQRALKVVKKA